MDEAWNEDCIVVRGLHLVTPMGAKTLLRDAGFTLCARDRVVVLGRNGVGKSSLFRWLREAPSRLPKGRCSWSVFEVPQELAPSDGTVLHVVLQAHVERGALWARRAWLEAQSELDEGMVAEYTMVGEQLGAMRADADPALASRILRGLGFSQADLSRRLDEFSGGWRARVALAQGLFMQPDLLLLDEPTNHLDLAACLWLANFLLAWPKTTMVVTHNAGFANSVSTAVWHFDQGALVPYASFASFTKLRGEADVKADKAWKLYTKQVSALKATATPAAKKKLQDLLRHPVKRPPKAYAPSFCLDTTTAAAAAAAVPVPVPYVALSSATFGYDPDHPVLFGVSVALYPGQRAALVGANGCGKSTLLKVLCGDSGVVVRETSGVPCLTRRSKTKVLAFDQHFYHLLPADVRALDYVLGGAEVPTGGMTGPPSADCVTAARRLLGASGLDGAAHTQALGTLSGGQKARVYCARIAMQQPDLLLLDEPTNHLDLETAEALAEALAKYPGAAVVVSHDMDFLLRVATDVWWVRDGTVFATAGTDALDAYADAAVASALL
jgi:ATP-binding cassette subfamily F protein 3